MRVFSIFLLLLLIMTACSITTDTDTSRAPLTVQTVTVTEPFGTSDPTIDMALVISGDVENRDGVYILQPGTTVQVSWPGLTLDVWFVLLEENYLTDDEVRIVTETLDGPAQVQYTVPANIDGVLQGTARLPGQDNKILESDRVRIQTRDISPTSQSNNIASASTENCSVRQDWLLYTVQAGDTLAAIARRSNSNVNELVVANCLTDANALAVGQQLRVPTIDSPVPTVTPTANIDPEPSETDSVPSGEPSVQRFSVRPEQAAPGDNITVTWDINQSVEVQLCTEYVVDNAPINRQCQSVGSDGVQAVTLPPHDEPVQTVDVILIAMNGAEQIEARRTLSSTDCSFEWGIPIPPVEHCPMETFDSANIIAQRFEGGWMLRLVDDILPDYIYVLLDSGGYSVRGVTTTYTIDEFLTPPDNRYAADAAFFDIWLAQRAALGWAIDPASNSSGGEQCEYSGSQTNIERCYLVGPRQFTLTLDTGMWE